ncbi:LysM domain/BON superfamily protein [Klebsiella pneumoniae]|nr:LysM domain/BON superfamily protein [Klebsiella pneumoniae]
MGLLNFVKEAGEKIWDAVSGDSKEDRAEKLKKHIDGLNLPGAEKVNIDVAEDGTATVTVMSLRRRIRKKFWLRSGMSLA